MVADKKRVLRPGHEFDILIPPPLGTLTHQRKWKGSHDSVAGVQQYARDYRDQTKKLAAKLQGATLRQTCENIWNFIYRHIQYKNDAPGYEQIRSPARSWSERETGVDCDDYSIITSSILLNLGIPHKLRMTDYGTGKGWQHIYVCVPKSGKLTAKLDQVRRDEYIVIDAVTDAFDYEVRYVKNEDFNMDIQFLNGLDGLGASPDYGVDGLGKTVVGKLLQKAGTAAKKTVQAVKTVTTTPIRLGILAIMKLNVKQGASRLRYGYAPYGPVVSKAGYGPKNHTKIVDSLRKLIGTFKGLGGDVNALRMAILTGAGNKDRAVPSTANQPGLGTLLAGDADWQALEHINSINSPLPNVPGLEGMRGLGVIDPATMTLITAAMTAVVPILNMLAKAKTGDPGDPIPVEYYEEAPADEQQYVEEEAPGSLGAIRAALKKSVAKPVVAAKKANPTTKVATPAAVKQAVVTKAAAKPAPVSTSAVLKSAVAVRPAPMVIAPLQAKTTVSPTAVTSTVRPIALKTNTTSLTLPTTLPASPVTTSAKAAQVIAKKKPNILQKVGGAVASIFKADPAKKAAKAQAKAAKKGTPIPANGSVVSTPSLFPSGSGVTAASALVAAVKANVATKKTPVPAPSVPRASPTATTKETGWSPTIKQAAQAMNPVTAPDLDMEALDVDVPTTQAPTVKEQRVAQVLQKTQKAPKAAQAIQKVANTLTQIAPLVQTVNAAVNPSSVILPTSEDETMDFTEETAAQAVAENAGSNLPAASAPKGLKDPFEWFKTTEGKPDMLKIGGAAVGVLVASKVLFGSGGSGYRRRGLAGTPVTSKKKSRQSGKKKRAANGQYVSRKQNGLGSLAAVELT